MEELSKSPIATLGIKDEEIKSGTYVEKVEEYVSKVRSWLKAG